MPATPEQVWASLTQPERLREWWPQMTLEPEEGGGFLEIWEREDGLEVRASGNVTRLREPTLIELQWSDEDWEFSTTVSITLAAEGSETRIAIRHAGWAAAGADASQLRDAHEHGWQRHLHRWRRHLRSTADR